MSDIEEHLSDEEGDEETRVKVSEDQAQFQQLTKETISQGLSLLCKTGNKLQYAFVKLNLEDKRLSDITAISSFIYIRFLDLSMNHLSDLSPLASLKDLLWLKVDNNAVSCFERQSFDQLTYLQWLSVAGNRVTDIKGLVGPSLESLNLTGNGIHRMTGFQEDYFKNLVTLDLTGNNLETTNGINLPKLQQLYLARNAIKSLEGLDKLERLTILHLRDNQIDSLDGLNPSMKSLKYLNIRGNAVAEEKALQNLSHVSKTLRALVLSENPLVETSDYRLSVLVILPKLERLDKNPISPDERSDARERIRELKEEEMPS
ncbi:leucine-rich repeat-containing protein 23 [Gouania willdenowi]|uniref:leucine-rich repeat-containing protein 23 n=1 Tax=Gouania willdenowi TaxID=441366 RepID=UPI001054665B|nr:leucine-rich repeat-containing protein 23 [Gouania willdenowi]